MNTYKSKVELMCDMQERLNNHTFPTWKTANLDWSTALMTETSEMIESIGWKWWKQIVPDVPNVKVEIIDLFHFFMSFHLVRPIYKTEIAANMSNYLKSSYESKIKQEDVINTSKKFIASVLLPGYSNTYKNLADLIAFYFDDFDEFARGYLTKNILNTFRQNNGYKDGTYKKMWAHKDTLVEDNVVAFKEASKLTIDEEFEINLIKKLNKAYKKKID
jgi:hypothetical protein